MPTRRKRCIVKYPKALVKQEHLDGDRLWIHSVEYSCQPKTRLHHYTYSKFIGTKVLRAKRIDVYAVKWAPQIRVDLDDLDTTASEAAFEDAQKASTTPIPESVISEHMQGYISDLDN